MAKKKTSKKTSKKTAQKRTAKKASKLSGPGAQAGKGLLDPGAVAPAFALPDQTGAVRSLRDYAGRPLVLYFYPKDDTEDCTAEACAFNDRASALGRVGCSVIGISRLDVKSKSKFAAKHGITFPLLADAEGKVSSLYGAWIEKSMYGKKFMAVSRTTYLIDADGRIAQRWDKVEVDGHADDVMRAVRAL